MKIGNLSINYKADEHQVVLPPPAFSQQISYAESPYWDDWWYLPYNPSDIYQKKGDYSLFDEMLEDDQISSVLALKKIITLNSPWCIESENDEIVEFIQDCFDKYMDDVFVKKMYEILSAMDYGFSITEKIAGVAEWNGRQRYVWKSLKTRAPHSFEFDVDEKGELLSVVQNIKSGRLELNPEKFIIYQYNKRFDNPYGQSELNKGVYRAGRSKDAIIKFWNIYLERFGMPTTVGKMPRSAGESDKSRFKQVLKNISAKTAITIPEDFVVELMQVAKGAGEYEKAIDKYNSFIARRLLLPDLMGFSGGETGGGSFALGKEQFDIFYTIIGYTRRDIENIVNRHLINPLVAWNYGPKETAWFRFAPVDEEQKTENMKLWLDAVKSGKVPVNDASVLWFLDSVGAPPMTDEELAEIKAEKDALKDKLNGDKEKTGDMDEDTDNKPGVQPDKPGEVDDTDGDEKRNISRDSARYADGIINGYTLSEYEKKVDFKKIESKQNEIESRYIEKLAEIYTLSINDLINSIKSQKIVENRKFEAINKLTVKYETRAKKIIKDMMTESYLYGKETVAGEKKFIIEPDGLDEEKTAAWLEEAALYVSSTESAFILKAVK